MKIRNNYLIIAVIAFALLFAKLNAATIEKNIEFNNGKLKFGGTLALPDTINHHPTIILVTGSGQQNRDEEIFGFKPFKQISDYLVERGYAVFRYDDRGVGESKNTKSDLDSATVFNFADDAYSALKALKNDSQINKNIDKNKIGILGHSEGGFIAQYLAAKYPEDINFIVLMAAPIVGGRAISNYQVEIANREAGLSEAGIDTIMKYQNLLVDAVQRGDSQESLKELLIATTLAAYHVMPEDKKKFITNPELYAQSAANMQIKQLTSPYIRAWFASDAQQYLPKIKCPVLAIFGEKDQQVPVSLNLAPLQKAFVGRENQIEIKIIKDANHLFQAAKTGSFSEYSKLEKKFADDFLASIQKFLDNKIMKK